MPGFKYVLVPCAAHSDMQELHFESDIEDLREDTFREFVEKYFANLGQSVDRSMLLQQLTERTGVDLQKKETTGEMPEGALDRLLASTSVEIFPVLMPTKDTNFNAISAYCDDKGVSKGLEENVRASSLVQACGYPGQTFRGDIFLGRVFDDTEDVWKRIDFALSDCSTDALWVNQSKMQRANRKSGDLASLANQVGAKNPAHITPGMLQDAQPTGETEAYRWSQTEDEVEITFKKEGLQKGDKKLVKVVFGRQKLKVTVKDEVLMDAALNEPTHPDESTWTLSDGVLQLTLAKVETCSWTALVKS